MLSDEHRQFQPHTHTLSYCRSNLYFNQSMFHNIMNIHFSRCCSFHAVLRFPLIDFVKTVNWSKFVRKTWVIGRYWRVHVFKSISYICIYEKKVLSSTEMNDDRLKKNKINLGGCVLFIRIFVVFKITIECHFNVKFY